MKGAKRIAAGTGLALAAYLALLALLSLLTVRGVVAEERTEACVWAFACLAAFLGAKVSAHGAAEPLAGIAGCAAAFWGAILLAGFLVNDALNPTRAAALAPPVLVGGALAYLLRANRKARGKGKRGRTRRQVNIKRRAE